MYQMDPSSPSSHQQEKAHAAWKAVQQARAKALRDNADTIDWKTVQKEAKNPKNLSVEFGPVMTEDQFREYCKSAGISSPQIVKTSK